MKNKTYYVPNISCKHCVHTISSELGEIKGVENVQVDVDHKKVNVVLENENIEAKVVDLLKVIGYPAREDV